MSDEDSSSEDGSYVAEESESDISIDEEQAPARARSAAELIAALEDAPDEEIRAMMREARPLRRGPADELPDDLLEAFARRVPRPCIPSPPGIEDGEQEIDIFALTRMFVYCHFSNSSVFFLVVLDEHLILLAVHAGVATLFAYDRYVVDNAFEQHGRLTLGPPSSVELNSDIVPIVEEQLFASSQDMHVEEKALSYARYFEPGDNGCWQVPWLPLADGTFRHDRSEQICRRTPIPVFQTVAEREQEFREMEAVFSGDLDVLYRLRKMEQLYTTPVQTCFMPGSIPFRDATNGYWPPGVLRRGRNWNRRKQLVLLRALESRGPRRATTRTPLARFLCRICPEPQFRDIVGRL